MKKVLINALVCITTSLSIFSQSVQLSNSCDSAVIILSEKVQSFGPNGNISYNLIAVSDSDTSSIDSFRGIKNLPDSLIDLKKYKIVLDYSQQYYQSYIEGKYTKDQFLELFQNLQWNLVDTSYLTKHNIKSTISIVAGYDQLRALVYIVDANNNSDFSDDTLHYLKSGLYLLEDVLRDSRYVDYEFYDGTSIKRDKILLNISKMDGSPDEHLYFRIPEFRYSKFIYKDKNYLVCQEGYNPERNLYVLLDKPYFSGVGFQYAIKPNQFINLDNEFFTYEPYFQTPGVIKIKKANSTNEIHENQLGQNLAEQYGHKVDLKSNQIGMVAPSVTGLNILSDSLVSSTNLKGKYVFLDFWATFCAPCIADFPKLLNVYNHFDRSQFEVIGIVKDVTGGTIKEFLQEKGVVWPNIIQDVKSTNISSYKIYAYPTTYLISPEGKIIATNLRGEELFSRLELLKVKKNNYSTH